MKSPNCGQMCAVRCSRESNCAYAWNVFHSSTDAGVQQTITVRSRKVDATQFATNLFIKNVQNAGPTQ